MSNPYPYGNVAPQPGPVQNKPAVQSNPVSVTDKGSGQQISPADALAAPSAPSWAGADPNTNPSYQTFLAGAGFNQSQIQAAGSQQSAALQAQLEAQRPYWAQTLQQGVRGALDNAAGRGTVRGSNRIGDQNAVEQNVNQQQAAYEQGIAGQQAGIQSNTANQLAQAQQAQAQQAISAQNDVYNNQLTNYQNELQNYYLNKLLGGSQ